MDCHFGNRWQRTLIKIAAMPIGTGERLHCWYWTVLDVMQLQRKFQFLFCWYQLTAHLGCYGNCIGMAVCWIGSNDRLWRKASLLIVKKASSKESCNWLGTSRDWRVAKKTDHCRGYRWLWRKALIVRFDCVPEGAFFTILMGSFRRERTPWGGSYSYLRHCESHLVVSYWNNIKS